jgi:tetratricopeptide (TPR) repeat protein
MAGASREKADAFLERQITLLDHHRALIDLQKHHLHVQLQQLQEQIVQDALRIWELRMGLLLRVATAVVGLALAVAIAFLIWDAIRSKGLLIEPFSVPPNLAARGASGEVLAQKLLDELRAIETANSGLRAPTVFANNWDQNSFRVEIPETGISLSELDRFLRQKLGSDTHVTGEVLGLAPQLAVSARLGSLGADTVSGPETELDSLVKRLAERVYRRAQPYGYGTFLIQQGRLDEALMIYRSMTSTGPSNQRALGYSGLSNLSIEHGTLQDRERFNERAIALDSENILIWASEAAIAIAKSQPERVVRFDEKELVLLSGDARRGLRESAVPGLRKRFQAQIDLVTADFGRAAGLYKEVLDSGAVGISGYSASLAESEIGEHDTAAARTTMLNPDSGNGLAPGNNAMLNIRAKMLIAGETGNWADLLAQAEAVDALLSRYPAVRSYLPTSVTPLSAYAQARLGNYAKAEVMISPTPADCYICLRTRARIAALRGEPARADWWFARAIALAPSIPLAHAEWGIALMSRGQSDAAIAKFKLANAKGPHFADPLEGWGEALMSKNQSHLALAKFAEANKYAPNWGRLHLKWGEALVYAGKKGEAAKQFVRAAQLDLTPSEKAELVRHP